MLFIFISYGCKINDAFSDKGTLLKTDDVFIEKLDFVKEGNDITNITIQPDEVFTFAAIYYPIRRKAY